jgi:hypothetical protein
MTPLQAQLLDLHSRIAVDDTDENALLRDKRDMVLQRLRDAGLSFRHFNQGSYATGTGIRPWDGDFDIDVGLIFDDASDDPRELKAAVYEAAGYRRQEAEWRRHCVRVPWRRAGEDLFHVDLALYRPSADPGAPLELAVGLPAGRPENVYWQPSDPKGLLRWVKESRRGPDGAQLRRVVRLLKRWKDLHFQSEGTARPPSVALTVAVACHLQPAPGDDAAAMESALAGMLAACVDQLAVPLPVAPRADLLGRMTPGQVQRLGAALRGLLRAVRAARRGDPHALLGRLDPDAEE